MKIISESAFEELKTYGHCVPRVRNPSDQNDTITAFSVGKEYQVKTKKGSEVLYVRCTQSHPTHIKVID